MIGSVSSAAPAIEGTQNPPPPAADEAGRRRQREHQYDRQVKIERLRVVVLVRDVAREVVLYEELIHERPAVARDDGRVPHSRDREAQRKAPDDSYLARPLAPQKIIETHDSRRYDYADQPLRQQRHADARVEPGQKLSAASLVPR